MEKEKKTSVVVTDAIHAINDVADRLYLLYGSADTALESNRKLLAFRDMSHLVLKHEIRELNRIMDAFGQEYNGLEFKPVKIKQ